MGSSSPQRTRSQTSSTSTSSTHSSSSRHPTPDNTTSPSLCSAYSSAAKPTEDWTSIEDRTERRRIQNRIAQRAYRQKLKERLVTLERKAASSSSSSSPGPEDDSKDSHLTFMDNMQSPPLQTYSNTFSQIHPSYPQSMSKDLDADFEIDPPLFKHAQPNPYALNQDHHLTSLFHTDPATTTESLYLPPYLSSPNMSSFETITEEDTDSYYSIPIMHQQPQGLTYVASSAFDSLYPEFETSQTGVYGNAFAYPELGSENWRP